MLTGSTRFRVLFIDTFAVFKYTAVDIEGEACCYRVICGTLMFKFLNSMCFKWNQYINMLIRQP